MQRRVKGHRQGVRASRGHTERVRHSEVRPNNLSDRPHEMLLMDPDLQTEPVCSCDDTQRKKSNHIDCSRNCHNIEDNHWRKLVEMKKMGMVDVHWYRSLRQRG